MGKNTVHGKGSKRYLSEILGWIRDSKYSCDDIAAMVEKKDNAPRLISLQFSG